MVRASRIDAVTSVITVTTFSFLAAANVLSHSDCHSAAELTCANALSRIASPKILTLHALRPVHQRYLRLDILSGSKITPSYIIVRQIVCQAKHPTISSEVARKSQVSQLCQDRHSN